MLAMTVKVNLAVNLCSKKQKKEHNTFEKMVNVNSYACRWIRRHTPLLIVMHDVINLTQNEAMGASSPSCNWVSEFITSISYLSVKYTKRLKYLVGRYVRFQRLR